MNLLINVSEGKSGYIEPLYLLTLKLPVAMTLDPFGNT